MAGVLVSVVAIVCEPTPVEPVVTFRAMDSDELSRVAEIDRRERIDVLYEQRGTQLVERHGRWDAAGWDPDGTGEHSVAAKVREAQQYMDDGGVVVGAFADDRLVGIGIVVPHLRPQIAQLAFLHVSAPFRKTGVGRRLSDQMDQIARDLGAAEMVVSATPSANTVRFYLARGFQPSEHPLVELAQLEPDDIHMHKAL
jgi:GNAT superfamily N-acetyltransferase